MTEPGIKSNPSNQTLTLQIILAMLLGGVCGFFWGTKLSFAGDFGKIIIQLIKASALPLVFFSIIEALLSTNIKLRIAPVFLLIIAINTFFAAGAGLILSNYFEAGSHLNIKFDSVSSDTSSLITKKYSVTEILIGYLPDSFVKPFIENSVIGVVIISLLIGSAARTIKNRGVAVAEIETFQNLISAFLKIFEIILLWIVRLVPIAVFGVMCKTVGQYGFAPFKALSFYIVLAFVGFLFQSLVVYQAWIALVCKRSLKEFWRNAREVMVYAFGTNSSLAALPLTLRALDRMKISKAASRLGACVGTNLNNDGILLYECMAVLFVTQAYGIHMPLETQIFTLLLCVLAAVGVAGVPEAGVVSLSLVLTAVNLPLEILGILLTVDWLVARGRSVVNALSDMTISIILDKFMPEKADT